MSSANTARNSSTAGAMCCPPQQQRVFRDIAACRTAALGTHVLACDHCPHQVIEYRSCRNRHCPKCHARARDQWLAARAQEILPVPYSHIIFTLPHELAPLALQNPRVVYGILFRAASKNGQRGLSNWTGWSASGLLLAGLIRFCDISRATLIASPSLMAD